MTASGPMRATVTCPSGSSTSVKNTSHDTCPWMLTGCTFFKMPSRVPLSTFSPQQDALERKEERTLVADALEQAAAILVEKPFELLRLQVSRVLREQRPPDPFDDVLGSGQDMRIDDQ